VCWPRRRAPSLGDGRVCRLSSAPRLPSRVIKCAEAAREKSADLILLITALFPRLSAPRRRVRCRGTTAMACDVQPHRAHERVRRQPFRAAPTNAELEHCGRRNGNFTRVLTVRDRRTRALARALSLRYQSAELGGRYCSQHEREAAWLRSPDCTRDRPDATHQPSLDECSVESFSGLRGALP
jgi:hypothetical protein